jgi:glycerol-3-phosphate dehydrogenase (NAD(P)+)
MRLGGRIETFMGLAGAGDLILTATSDLSRNRRVGLQLAEGRALPDIVARLGHVAEGVNTAREVLRLSRECGIEMPITGAVCQLVDGGVEVRSVVDQLLQREPGREGVH